MKRVQRGFTVIESMLFLAVSGGLILALLVGTGLSISTQRYRDSVVSLQSILQDQYSETLNTRNGQRDQGLACSVQAAVVESSVAPDRGRADCVILGKYITPVDQTTLRVATVVGYGAINTVQSTDVAVLQSYALGVVPNGDLRYQTEWGAQLVRQGGSDASGAPLQFSLLILRSPVNGSVRTFIEPSTIIADTDLRRLITSDNLEQSLTICVDNEGIVNLANMAVHVTKYATGPTGVEMRGDAESGC